jgi:hypothetical protein
VNVREFVDHREAMPLAADWARGRLDAERAREVEAHVRVCTMCREAVEAANSLDAESRRLVEANGGHPSSEALARYVDTPQSESVASLATTGTHLRSCARCREDVALMRAAAAPSWSRWLRSWATGEPAWATRVLQPALAVLAVLLVFPAWLGLIERPRERAAAERRVQETETRIRRENEARQPSAPAPAARGGGVAVLVLRGPTRGGDALPSVRLRAGQAFQPVLLDMPSVPAQVRVVVIRDPGREVWMSEGSREEFFDAATGLAGVLIPVEVLTPGDYRLEVRPGAAAPPAFTSGFRVLPARAGT